MFNFLKNKLAQLFSRTQLDAQTRESLEKLLLEADFGVPTTKKILEKLAQSDGAPHDHLTHILTDILTVPTAVHADARVILCVGINGSGKTTFAGKLAHQYAQQNKRVLLVAADTFRAAAPEQLHAWAHRAGADIVLGKPQQDPSSVVYAGCQKFKDEQYDILIIDTAGRLQTKAHLLQELDKMRRTITRQLPNDQVATLLTVDAMLGQNSLEQARIFNECTPLTGIVLTKYDGTGKGGIVFAITQELRVPIAYISYGERIDQLKSFDAHEFVNALIE